MLSSDQQSLALSIAQEVDSTITADMISNCDAVYDSLVNDSGYPAYTGSTGPAMAPGSTLAMMEQATGYSAQDCVAYLVAMNQIVSGTAVNPNPSITDYLTAGASGISQGVTSAVSDVSNAANFLGEYKTPLLIGGGVILVLYLFHEVF